MQQSIYNKSSQIKVVVSTWGIFETMIHNEIYRNTIAKETSKILLQKNDSTK